MHLTLRLRAPRVALLRRDGGLRLRLWCEGALLDDDEEELAVHDAQGTEHLRTFAVEFVESRDVGALGFISYSTRWTDPESGKAYPGAASIQISLERETIERLAAPSQEKSWGVIVELRVQADSATVHHIGPPGAGEWVWNAHEAKSLPVELQSVGLAPDSSQPSPPAPSRPPPLSAQDVAPIVSDLKSVIATVTSESNSLKAELRRIRLLLVLLLVLLLIYATARAA